ncbi:MAG: DUF4123 domain-containing protein [Paracoccus sp. (in: a-proteobacteria)]|nr:DUF4123 domain-containing protein [Paracoccus sp. (in: a-proteobacteria)]
MDCISDSGEGAVPLARTVIDARLAESRPDLPWWDRPWIAPPLQKALFAAGAPVYWLADPTRYAQTLGGGELDGPQTMTLGAAALPGIEAALPRLIGPINPERPGRVIRQAVTQCLGHRVGLFLTAEVGRDQLARHLQRFIFMRGAGHDRPLFFRFWDPAVALAFLRINHDRPERIGRFLGVPGGPVLNLVAETGPDAVELVQPAPDIPRAPAEPELDMAELAAFGELEMDRFVQDAAVWLVDTYGGTAASRHGIEAAIRNQIGPLRAMGIVSEYATNFALAGLYILGAHAANLPAEGRALLTGHETEDERAARFLTWAQHRAGHRGNRGKGDTG